MVVVPEAEADHVARFGARHGSRDGPRAQPAIAAPVRAVRESPDVMPGSLVAVRAGAAKGEWGKGLLPPADRGLERTAEPRRRGSMPEGRGRRGLRLIRSPADCLVIKGVS